MVSCQPLPLFLCSPSFLGQVVLFSVFLFLFSRRYYHGALECSNPPTCPPTIKTELGKSGDAHGLNPIFPLVFFLRVLGCPPFVNGRVFRGTSGSFASPVSGSCAPLVPSFPLPHWGLAAAGRWSGKEGGDFRFPDALRAQLLAGFASVL